MDLFRSYTCRIGKSITIVLSPLSAQLDKEVYIIIITLQNAFRTAGANRDLHILNWPLDSEMAIGGTV